MLRWSLEHPTAGQIVLERGSDAEFCALDPDWPEQEPQGKEEREPNESRAGAGLRGRILSYLARPRQRVRVLVNGEVVGRYSGTPATINLKKNLASGKFSTPKTVAPSQPQLRRTKNFVDEPLLVAYKHGAEDEYIELDAPPGSRAEAYQATLDVSPAKRALFPFLFGLGKSVWYIVGLILAPLVARIIKWLVGQLPEFNVAAPQIDLPVPVLRLPSPPDIDIPAPQWKIPWPDISLPTPPDWVFFLLEHSKA